VRDRQQHQHRATSEEHNTKAVPLERPGLLATIVEGTTDAVFVKDLDGRYLMVNSACARILGRPKEEIIGKDDAQLLPPETAGRLAEADRRVMHTGEPSSYEEVLPVAGQPRTYLSTKSVQYDAEGNAGGIIGISRDITERKRGEEHLRRSRDQLDAILHGVTDGITAQDPSGRLIYAKECAAHLFGYPSARELLVAPAQEVLDRFEIMDKSGRPFPLDQLPGRRALGGESAPEQLLYFRASATGEQRWSVVRATPIFDEHGEILLAVNIFRDVTESRRAEQERARLAAIVQSSDDAIIGKTLDGIITN
jgi:PAS domain S-box-containing protein